MPPATASPPPRAEIAALPRPQLIERYRTGITLLPAVLLELTPQQADTFFGPEAAAGRWSCRAVIGHLADAELVFTHRLRRTAAEDGPILPGFDENAFLDAGLYGDPESNSKNPAAAPPIAGFIALIHTLRAFTTPWLLTLPDSAWDRPALHQRRGPRTLQGLLIDAAHHLEHHAWFLDRKLQVLGIETS